MFKTIQELVGRAWRWWDWEHFWMTFGCLVVLLIFTWIVYIAVGFTVNSPTVVGCKISDSGYEFIDVGDKKYEKKHFAKIYQIVNWSTDNRSIGSCEYGDNECYKKYLDSDLCKPERMQIVCEKDNYIIECKESDLECYKKYSCN